MQVDFRSLKICFVAGTLGQGGAERQLYYIVKALRQLGSAPTVLSLTKGEFWEERIRELGVPVIWVGQSRSRFDRLRRVTNCLKNIKPDIVQSQHFHANLYVAVAGRLLGVRQIGALRSDGISEVRQVGRLLGAISLRAPMFIAANSRQGIENVGRLGIRAHKLFHLPNVIDTQLFLPAIHGNNGRMKILAVGRLEKQKRFDRFLHILSRLATRIPHQFDATIVGDGPDRLPLKHLAAQLNLLPDTVQFVGPSSNIQKIYQEAGILLLTSDWEGTPNVVLEAMACGLPVIATKVGDVPVIIKDGESGFLFSPDDEEGMVDRLVQLAGDTMLRERIGRRARMTIQEHFSVSTLPEALTELYQAVLST